MDQGNSVWAPPPNNPPSHPSRTPPHSPVVSRARCDPQAFRFSSPDLFIFITTMKISMMLNAYAQWTPSRLFVCKCWYVCVCGFQSSRCVCVCVCGQEWQCHLLITRPMLCRQGDLAERLRGLGGYYCVLWQVSPKQGLSKQRFHKTVTEAQSPTGILQKKCQNSWLFWGFLVLYQVWF